MNITVEVVEQFTESSPGRLRIGFANEAPTEREFLFDTIAPFDALVGSTTDGQKVHAIPDDDEDPVSKHRSVVIPREPIDGCWKLTSSYGSEGFGLRWPAEAGAMRSMTYSVLGDPTTADYIPSGEYRFEGEWGEHLGDHEDRWHLWGFTAAVQQ